MNTQKQILAVFVAALFSAVLILSAVFVGAQIGSTKTAAADPAPAETTTDEPAADPEPAIDPDNIIITGFEKMRLKAGTYSQDCDLLYNSASNTCAIVFSLYMPDGSVFYVSDPVKPGQRVEKMEIDKLLTAGTYEGCRMSYDCYDLETDATLNGADINFTLEVLP